MTHTARMPHVLSQVRKAIDHSGETRYAISKATGIGQAQLSRLMAGEGGLSIESLECLTDYLGLEVVIRPKSRPKRAGARKRRA